MESFGREDFEKLSQIRSKICISLFIPTHRKGMEVNEGHDEINFKNQVQNTKEYLEGMGYQEVYVRKLLQPAYLLLEDTIFWKQQNEGLAFFLYEDGYWYYKLPIAVEPIALISSLFELTPLIPLLFEDMPFYVLTINQSKVALYKGSKFEMEEVDLQNKVPSNIKEIYQYHEFDRSLGGKRVSEENNTHESIGNIMFDSSQGYLDTDKYLPEYFRKINSGIKELLPGEGAPLILAANEDIAGIYQKINSYPNLMKEVIDRQVDDLPKNELHKKAFSIVRKELEKPKKKVLQKYQAFEGTGKTSANIESVIVSAFAGRIDSLIVQKSAHIWGLYNDEEQKVEVHSEYTPGDVCLINLAAIKTVENSGVVFMTNKEEMPASASDTKIAAIYRY